MLISDEYRELNSKLHETREDYGRLGSRWAPLVMALCANEGTMDVLDYGCGKGTLNLSLPFGVHCYDPAVPKFSATPKPADIVVCTDVAEHIEPDCLDDVLDDLQRVTGKVLVLNVATRPAVKTLADGRNAHLIVEQWEWWRPHIEKRWRLRDIEVQKGEFTAILEPKGARLEYPH